MPAFERLFFLYASDDAQRYEEVFSSLTAAIGYAVKNGMKGWIVRFNRENDTFKENDNAPSPADATA